MLGLPGLPRPEARERPRARHRRGHDALADGRRGARAGHLQQVLRRRPGPARAGGPGHGRAPRHVRARLLREVLRGPRLPRPRQLHGQLQRRGHALRDRRAQGLGGDQLLLQHRSRPREPDPHGRALVAARRLRPDAGHERPGVRVVRLPGRRGRGERLGMHRRPRSRLLAREPLSGGDRPSRDTGGRASNDQGDGVPPADERAHRELRRVPRLLAAALLQQRGRDRRVLGVPREGGRDGPLPVAQVGGARPGRRDAHAMGGHARHTPARRRPGGLHRRLQRDRRHDRRRHGLPPRAGQLPLHRRGRVRRRLAEGAGRAARAEGEREALDGPAATTWRSRAPRAASS